MAVEADGPSGGASGNGGGLFDHPTGIATIDSTTFALNTTNVDNANPGDGGDGQAIFDDGGVIRLAASIVAKNGEPACAGAVTDEGYNINNDGSCGLTAAKHSIGSSPTIDASIGALAKNGGPTATFLPTASSPAVARIPIGTKLGGVSVCARIDQRGVANYGKCTIGAVEGGFLVTTTSLGTAMPGKKFSAVKLTVQEVAPSTKPLATTLSWKGLSPPVGLNLTAKGVLSGSLGKSVALGRVNARVQVTEVVTTVVKGKKVTTTTSVKATIPLEVT